MGINRFMENWENILFSNIYGVNIKKSYLFTNMFIELDIKYILCRDLRNNMKVESKDRWHNIHRESMDPNLIVPDFKATNRGHMAVKEYVAMNSKFKGDSSRFDGQKSTNS